MRDRRTLRQHWRGVKRPADPPETLPEGQDTRDKLGELAGVSHDTIAKVKKIDAVAPEEAKEKLRAGEVTITCERIFFSILRY